MANNVIPGMAGICVRSTGEHVSANIFGSSGYGDNYIQLKYMRNGKEIEHNAAFDKVLFPIRSPSPSPSDPPHVCCQPCCAPARPCLSTGWALNRRFDLTFGTAAVLAQGGGLLGTDRSPSQGQGKEGAGNTTPCAHVLVKRNAGHQRGSGSRHLLHGKNNFEGFWCRFELPIEILLSSWVPLPSPQLPSVDL